jgi:branched-subunit amino acid aminotransferase/4-amino-4-deoxychorismate lyase
MDTNQLLVLASSMQAVAAASIAAHHVMQREKRKSDHRQLQRNTRRTFRHDEVPKEIEFTTEPEIHDSMTKSNLKEDEGFFISINGKAIASKDGATISIFDQSFHRGDGVFEVMRITKSEAETVASIRSLEQHMERLQTSAREVGCPLPSMETLKEWLNDALVGCGHRPGSLRLIATKGEATQDIKPSVVLNWSPLPEWPATFTLLPVLAPWHPAGVVGWETPIKWTSYGPNIVSSQKAKDAGFTDALLLSPHRVERPVSPNTWKDVPVTDFHVLDGPNFAVGFVQHKGDSEAVLHLPCNETLGLLPSITQARVAAIAQDSLGMTVKRGVYTLGELLELADEVLIMSTTRGVKRVAEIGSHKIVAKTNACWSDKIAELVT